MTRQVTDNLYIDLDYFTPEEYYTYEAVASATFAVTASISADFDVLAGGVIEEASAALTSTALLSADIDKLISTTAALSATATQTATATRIIEFAATWTAVFSPTLTAIAIKNIGASVNVTASLSASPVVNRATSITLSSIANVNAQAAKQVSTSVGLTSAFTFYTTRWAGSGRPRNLSGVGSSGFDSSTKKFGTHSLSFNGSVTNTTSISTRPKVGQSWAVEWWGYNSNIASTTNQSVQFQWLQGGFTGTSGTTAFLNIVDSTGTTVISFSQINTVPVNAWCHFLVICDGTRISYYVNGTRRYTTTTLPTSYSGNNSISLLASSPAGGDYLDEVGIWHDTTLGYNPANSTVTPPSVARTNNEFTLGLWHLDNNLLDDVSAFTVSAGASLASTAAITAQLTGPVKFQSALTSTATLQAQAEKVVEGEIDFTSDFAQSATVTRIKQIDAELPVIATQLSAVGKVGDALAACDVVATLSADVSITTENELDFSANFAQTANTDRLRGFNSDLSADFAQSADVSITTENELDFFAVTALAVSQQRLRGFNSDLSADFAQTVDNARTRDFDSTQTVTATVTAQLGIVKEFDSALPVIASQLTATAKIGQGLIDCQVTATLFCDAEVTSGSIVNLTSTATLQAQAGKLQVAQANISANAQLTAQPEVVGTLDADLSAEFAQSTTVTRQRDYTSALSSAFTQSALVEIVKSAQAQLSAQAQSTVSASRTRNAVANLPVIASQLTVGSETNDLRANLTAQFTLTCQVIEVRIDPDLTYMVPSETRAYTIPEELRDDIIIPESRAYTIVKEIRDYSVTNTEETYII